MFRNETIAKLLNLKKGKKTEIELEVRKEADKLDEENRKLEALHEYYSQQLASFEQNHSNGGTDSTKVDDSYGAISSTSQRIQEQKAACDRQRDALEQLKQKLISAHQEKKMFEILNDREVTREMKARHSAEQKENDFIAIARRSKS